jgi:SPP1 gp7 family putative phage head morphogenesis protein
VPMTRAEWNKLTQGQREHAFMVSEVATADIVTEVWEALDSAIAKGTTLEEFKAEIGPRLLEHWGGDKPGRIETIFRTNVMSAYNGGRHEMISAPTVRKFRPFLRFDGIDDDSQTEICKAAEGVVLPADDPWWASHTPPLHFNCRSVVTPLAPDEAEDEGIDDEPPDQESAEGFGVPPSTDGPDWTPDLIGYPAEIRKTLEERLKKRGEK